MELTSYFDKNINFSNPTELENCMKHFSENEDLSLSFENFENMIKELLTDSEGKSYDVSELILKDMFTAFDANSDGRIDVEESSNVWHNFIKPLVKPVTALLIIDVQNDFIDGSLALKNCRSKQDGKDVVPVINSLLENLKFNVVVYTMDYHPKDHISFYENIQLYKLSENNENLNNIQLFDTVTFENSEMKQKLWPTHCVQNTWGCELSKELKQVQDALVICKGENSHIDSYSAFFDNMKLSSTKLHQSLKERKVTHIFICGLAFDYCVAYTALDAIELGYATAIIQNATKGTDDDNIKIMTHRLKSRNCVLTDTNQVERLINGKDKRIEFATTFLNKINK